MLKNENIICISSIDWDFVWQGHQEIMSTLAKHNNKILFIENTGVRSPKMADFGRIKSRIRKWFKSVKGYRQIKDNIFLFSPVVLPFPYSRLVRHFNSFIMLRSLKRWMKSSNFQFPIIWTFLPTGLTVDIINKIDHKASVYYCIDNFRESSIAAKKITGSEIKVIQMVDVMFVTSYKLYEYAVQFKAKDKIRRFPFGVNIKGFEDVRNRKEHIVPDDMAHLKRPFVGYIGGIHKWIDQELVRFIAAKFPAFSFIFVGPIQCDVSKLKGFDNVCFVGMKRHEDLPLYADAFDVGIIPYLLTKYTENVYPTKLNEYLSMGKAVVSTNLPEVVYFNSENDNIVYVAQNKEDFAGKLSYAINFSMQTGNVLELEKEKRINAAQKNTWENRIEEMSDVIEDVIDDVETETLSSWENTLLNKYVYNRIVIFKFVLLPVLLYFMIFYSPLMRIIARPLIVRQPLEAANAIAVIGGGAGESGIVGQGYEERVKYAVDIYKNGYADKIVFSSGYSFMFKEPDIMKAMAISLGVYEKDIILDVNSGSTYENVIAIKGIVKDNGWNKLILISSPYHMLRTSLVFKEKASNIEVIYSPLPFSQFYNYNVNQKKNKWFRKVKIKEIRGFLHEYVGIIYYWWKGYIVV